MRFSLFSKILVLATISLAMHACQTDIVYYSYLPLSNDGWRKSDTLEFVIPDSLSNHTYELGIGVRHRETYPYRDLWLELTQSIPVKDSIESYWIEKKDTFHIYLANEKGIWHSSGTTGGFYQLMTPCGKITLPSYSDTDYAEEDFLSENENPDEKGSTGPQKKRKQKYTFSGTEISVAEESKNTLKLVHIMTDSVLHHISDMGIRLTVSPE